MFGLPRAPGCTRRKQRSSRAHFGQRAAHKHWTHAARSLTGGWPVAVAWQSRGVGPRPAGVLYKVATSRRLSRPLNRTCSRQIDWPRACMEGCLAGTKHDDNPGPNS